MGRPMGESSGQGVGRAVEGVDRSNMHAVGPY